jgi:phosphatidylserine decarboxylase
MGIAREGWPYVITLLALSGLTGWRWPWLGGLFLALGLFTLFFFRDPERSIPGGPRLVVSPADGKVIKIGPAPDDQPLGPGATQVSIFLSIFNVHVNRAPVGGRLVAVNHHPGEFLPAWDDKASLRNEQNTVTVDDGAHRVVFKQIAGLIARRIVFRKKVDEQVERGERVGLIKFGSRVDLFLPPGTRLGVSVGDRVQGGSSVLGELP